MLYKAAVFAVEGGGLDEKRRILILETREATRQTEGTGERSERERSVHIEATLMQFTYSCTKLQK